MKSLVLKDVYNIGHNMKSLCFMFLLFAVAFIPTSGVAGFSVFCAVLCSMMVITTFNFDENCHWVKYALVMPLSRKQYVQSKFIALILFSSFGAVVSLVLGTLGSFLYAKVTAHALPNLLLPLLTSIIGLLLGTVFGSMSLVLLFRFGAEKARMFTLVSYFVPVGIVLVVAWLLRLAGIAINEKLLIILLCCLPIAALLFCFAMYRISCHIFSQKELVG